jgi:hypothetical protein
VLVMMGVVRILSSSPIPIFTRLWLCCLVTGTDVVYNPRLYTGLSSPREQ